MDLKPDSAEYIADKDSPFIVTWEGDSAITPESRLDEDENWWMVKHHAIVDSFKIYKEYDIIFIGDSITSYWENDKYYDREWGLWTFGKKYWDLLKKAGYRIKDMGFHGDQTQHVIWRLKNGEFPRDIICKTVVLLIGTNNASTEKSIAAGIGEIASIIHETSPMTKILILSILPRKDSNPYSDQDIKVQEVNKILKTYDGYNNIQFGDIYDAFLDPDTHEINTGLYNYDNFGWIHPNEKGYGIELKELSRLLNLGLDL
ncbi:GDSL-type esterase/lipase family protein [Leadbettera azotonutricia]|nr:GDSL-type esterase/lipase family protein [Leadbettera azotonutricia]